MKRSPGQQFTFLLAILSGALPFVFGLIRLLQTHTDYRLLWMALASFLGAMGVKASEKARARKAGRLAAQSGVVFVTAALFTGVTAILLGATSAAGIWGMAIVFGGCWAISSAIDTLSRPRTI